MSSHSRLIPVDGDCRLAGATSMEWDELPHFIRCRADTLEPLRTRRIALAHRRPHLWRVRSKPHRIAAARADTYSASSSSSCWRWTHDGCFA